MELSELEAKIEGFVKRSLRERRVPLNQAGSAVGSPGQGMQKRLHEMFDEVLPGYDLGKLLVMDVGDRVHIGSEAGYDIKISLPVASDIWYLTIGPSIIPFVGDDYQENAKKILGFLTAYLVKLDNIEPLRSLQSYKDLRVYSSWMTGDRKTYDGDNAPKVIREMRFETWMLNRNTEFPSKGPKACAEEGKTDKPNTAMGALYSGFLAFPVGPLGVMEVTSIFSESMIDMLKNKVPFTPDGSVKIEDPDDGGWKCVRDQPLDGFMSPMTDITGKCPGVHLVNKGYIIDSLDAEYPVGFLAKTYPVGSEVTKEMTEADTTAWMQSQSVAERLGADKILPFHSCRYYLRRDAQWPLPGEFIGLLAKPWPAHVWWFQKTSPFLYSGNWFETNHYTSGIVKEIMVPIEGVEGTVYKCVIRGVEVCVASSDYYDYKVDDRVAIIRIDDLDRFMNTTKGNFKWNEMDDLIAREKLEKGTPSNLPYIVNASMMIVPMSFYKPPVEEA